MFYDLCMPIFFTKCDQQLNESQDLQTFTFLQKKMDIVLLSELTSNKFKYKINFQKIIE